MVPLVVSGLLAISLLPGAGSAQIIPNTPQPAERDSAAFADTVAADTTAREVRLSAAADSVRQVLQALPGYTITEYTGDAANFRTDTGILRLEGNARVDQDGMQLTTDTLVYYQRDRLIETFGDSAYVHTNEQDLVGQRLIYDLTTRRATALQARTEVTESSATWIVTGDMTVEGTNRLLASHASFTSCDLLIPHYHFESDEVMVIRNRILVARPARFYIGEVPLFWLPFVVQNLEQGRRSGLLTPRFGINDIVRTSSGYNRQITNVGFYWAINDYMGAEVSTNWRSGAYTSLLGTLGFNWRRQFLSGNISAERYWPVSGARQLSLSATTNWQPDERTTLALSGRYASSGEFVRQSTYDPREATQDLSSTLNITRRFDWGQMSLGGDRRQSISNGDVSTGFPTFSISPRALTLFRSTNPETARWFNDITLNIGSITASRSSQDFARNVEEARRDQTVTRFSTSPSLTIGNLSLSMQANGNRAASDPVSGLRDNGEAVDLLGFERDELTWSASIGYRQQLIGTTSISPGISLNQAVVRDTLTNNEYISGPLRYSFGAGVNTDLFGFYPGIAGFSTIRHRISPFVSYSYSPAVAQTPEQEAAFGPAGGRTQNRITFGLNQTWEAKLRNPPSVPQDSVVRVDSITGDTIRQSQVQPVAGDPQKVTLLSITTSAFAYDFTQKKEEGTGFLTREISNSISSDYLRGLTIQMQHELFDRRDLAPTPENTGKLGRFAPRLSQLATSFQLGPESAVFRWLNRFGFGSGERAEEGFPSLLPGSPEDDTVVPAGTGAFTGNNRGTGRGPWNVSLSYHYSRMPRNYSADPLNLDDRAEQTVNGNMSFQLTEKWNVSWRTDYSFKDNKFGTHALNFQREIHEWQANFSFYQTPNGNSGFEFYVQLLHNTDLRFDYREQNLGIDRNRSR